MWRLVIAATLVMGCGAAAPMPDLSAATDIDAAQVALDFALEPADLVLASVDFALSPCTLPQPGIYNESVAYNYAPAGGGTSSFAQWTSTVVRRNDGTFQRAPSGFASPDRYHCEFTTVDQTTCLAQCCPGQVSSPTMYFDKGGWTLWLVGACAFQTTTGAAFIANVTFSDGYFVR